MTDELPKSTSKQDLDITEHIVCKGCKKSLSTLGQFNYHIRKPCRCRDYYTEEELKLSKEKGRKISYQKHNLINNPKYNPVYNAKRPFKKLQIFYQDSGNLASVECKGCTKGYLLTTILNHLQQMKDCANSYDKNEIAELHKQSKKCSLRAQRSRKHESKKQSKKCSLRAKRSIKYESKRFQVKCPICKDDFEHNAILKHLAKNKECKSNYTKEMSMKFEKQVNFLKNLSDFYNASNGIKLGPNFTCICCIRDLFKRTVMEVTQTLLDHLTAIGKRHLIKEGQYEYENKSYICQTCYRYLMKCKMPPQCFHNNLDVSPLPDCFKNLYPVEKQMLQKKLIFLKVRYLKKTRMPSFVDRVVNVPLDSADLIKTAKKLPRVADELGTVSVMLKREMGKTTYHKFEKVRPKKINACLKYLKKYHSEYLDMEISKLDETEEWIDVPLDEPKDYGSDIEVGLKDNEKSSENSIPSNNEDLSSDEEDNVFNSNTVLVPEEPANNIYVNTTKKTIKKKLSKNGPVIEIAPGEQKAVRGNWYTTDESFDICAFPEKHPDGKYGLHAKREVKLNAKSFFNQRILNNDPRFQRDAEYLYVVEQLCTRKTLESQIDLSTRKGSLKKSAENPGHFKLEKNSDHFNIFKKIGGSPSYWQHFRQELFATVEQLGPFHGFFTLSCGEKEWPEIYAAILRKMGRKIKYIDVTWRGTFQEIIVDGIPLDKFIEDNIKNSSDFMREHFVLITQMFNSRVLAFLTHILKKSGIGHYTYRIEFQLRGMPHVHGVAWFDKEMIESYINADGSFNNSVTEFADEFISVSLENQDPEINTIVKKVNIHRHTKSCRKKNLPCRFDFPKPPSEKTLIARPPPDDMPDDELEKLKGIGKKIKDKLNEIEPEEEDMSLDEFLESIGMEGQHDQYYKAISLSTRGKILVLKRSVKERMINNYNPNFIKAWNANMDFQMCLDHYAVITYISDYFTKADMNLTKQLKDALKDAKGKDDFELKTHLKKTFIGQRQMSVCECAYSLIPGLDLKGSSVATKFVATGFPEDRQCLYRQVDDQKVDGDECETTEENENSYKTSRKFRVEGRQGIYVASQTSIHEYYSSRPPILQDMCLAEFASKYHVCSASTIAESKININENRVSDIIGVLRSFNSNELLPKYIHLINGSFMKLKEHPLILRTHKEKDPVKTAYAALLLFHPWIDENELMSQDHDEMQLLYNNCLEAIEANRKRIFPFAKQLEEITLLLSSDSNDIQRNQLLIDSLDATGEQENEDDAPTEPLDTTELPPDEEVSKKKKTKSDSSSEKKAVMKPIILNPEDIRQLYNQARSLSYAQKIVFDKIIHYIRCVAIEKKGGIIKPDPPMILVNGMIIIFTLYNNYYFF